MSIVASVIYKHEIVLRKSQFLSKHKIVPLRFDAY
jgi:hypothetical protein